MRNVPGPPLYLRVVNEPCIRQNGSSRSTNSSKYFGGSRMTALRPSSATVYWMPIHSWTSDAKDIDPEGQHTPMGSNRNGGPN
jgi:hypothetical protein